MSGKKNTTTSSSQTTAFPGAEDILNAGIPGIQSLYSSGQLAAPFRMPSVAGFDSNANTGRNWAVGAANVAKMPMQNAFMSVSNINSNPLSAMQQNAATGFEGISSQASDPSWTEQNLGQIARGDYLSRTDPNFERLLTRSLEGATNSVNEQASAAGRYGGAVHQGNLARTVGDLEADARFGQYQSERGAQERANAAIDAQRLSGMNTQMGALGSLASLGQQGIANQMGAAAQLPGQYQAMLAPSATFQAIGAENMALQERQMADQRQGADAEYQALLRLLGGGSYAVPYATQSNTQTQPGPSPVAQGIGALGSAFSLFS